MSAAVRRTSGGAPPACVSSSVILRDVDRDDLRARAFIAHYACGGEVRAAATAACISEATAYRLLKDDSVLQAIAERQAAGDAEIAFQTVENMRTAVHALAELLEDWTACQSNPFARLAAVRLAAQMFGNQRISELTSEVTRLRVLTGEPEPAAEVVDVADVVRRRARQSRARVPSRAG